MKVKNVSSFTSNEEGVTLIEMIVTFAIVLVLMSVTASCFSLLHENRSRTIAEQEITLFHQQLKMDAKDAMAMEVENGELLLFKKPETTVRYKASPPRVIRTVNRSGHEIVFQHIRHWSMEPMAKGVLLSITDEKSHEYTLPIPLSPSAKEVKNGWISVEP